MHRKTSTIRARLADVAISLISAAAYLLITGVRAVRSTASAWLGASLGGRLRGRGRAVGLLSSPALALALLAGGSGALSSSEPIPGAVLASNDRDALAERADRSTRATEPAAAAPAEAVAAPAPPPAWSSPMPGVRLSSCFGPRWGTAHQGMDFAAPAGTPIVAAGAGTVFGVGWLYAGYGISVVIDHGNGFFTHYAHASDVNVVEGQSVVAGEVIAWEGSTGNSTGPHLHFEVHAGLWNQINPAVWLREYAGIPIGC